MTTTDNVALPTGNGVIAGALYTLGPIYINGSALPGVTGVKFMANCNVESFSSDGDLYGTWQTVMTRSPRFEITLKDATVLNDFGIGGVAQGATASKIFLRKYSKGASRVADATAEHIKFTMNASQGMVWPGTVSGGNDGLEGTLILQPIKGSSDQITISTGVAIS